MTAKRILLVEYDVKNLTHMREVLEGAGFDVTSCGDGIAALDQFKSLSPDLILLSPMLPKLHGFEVCSSIRKLPGGETIPVVMITDVYKGNRYRSDALNKHGATEYIERPIGDASLVSILRGLVGENGRMSEPDEPVPEVHRDDLIDRIEPGLPKTKVAANKPKAKNDMDRKLEQSLAALDLELGKKTKPKSKPSDSAKPQKD